MKLRSVWLLGRERKQTKAEANPYGMTARKAATRRHEGRLAGQLCHFGVGGDEGQVGHVEEEAVLDYADDLADGCG